MASGGRDRDKDKEGSARDAALWDPDSVFHDYTAETTASRAIEALSASSDKTAAADPDMPKDKNPRREPRRSGALTKEMIKRIADRAEQAAKDNK